MKDSGGNLHVFCTNVNKMLWKVDTIFAQPGLKDSQLSKYCRRWVKGTSAAGSKTQARACTAARQGGAIQRPQIM
jgi:hypothetical protein